MMGVGKSTIGARLAGELRRPFIDTDHEVEIAAGKPIAQIFADEGECHFRQLEAEAIDRAAQSGAVIALGGGAVADPDAMDRLRDRGETVYLEAPAAVLVERIGDPSSRPLLAGLDRDGKTARVETLLVKRLSIYARAKEQVDASGTVEEVTAALVGLFSNEPVKPRGQDSRSS